MLIVRQSTARIVTVGPVLDADGVAVTGGVVADFKISKNGAAPAALNGSATLTHRSVGFYSLSLTATDLDTVGSAEVVIDDTVNACPMKELTVIEGAVYDISFADAATGAVPVASIAAGAINAAAIATGAIDADAIADNAIDAGAIAADAITAAKIANGAIDAATFAAGAIDATAIAAGAFTAAKFAAGAFDAVWTVAARILTAATNITSTGGTTVPQTGDSFARLGAPAGASVSADIASVKGDTVGIAAAVSVLPTAVQNADALLARDLGSGTNAGTLNERTVRSALRFLRNFWSIAAGTLTVRTENDSTTAWTAAVTTAATDPVQQIDPA